MRKRVRKRLDDILYYIKYYNIDILLILILVAAIASTVAVVTIYHHKKTETVDFCEECGGRMVYTDSIEHTSFIPMYVGGSITLLPSTDIDYVYTCEDCGRTITTDIEPK